MPLDNNLRQQVIIAAATAAAPFGEGYNGRLRDAAKTIALAIGPQSPVSKDLELLVGGETKQFVGEVLNVEIEPSSTRGLVTIKGTPSQYHEDGIEQARTERTDREDGKAMYERIAALKGHRVLFFVSIQTFGTGAEARKMRVLVHAEDLGQPREWTGPSQQSGGYQQPAQSQSYQQSPPARQEAPPQQGGWGQQAPADPWATPPPKPANAYDEEPPF